MNSRFTVNFLVHETDTNISGIVILNASFPASAVHYFRRIFWGFSAPLLTTNPCWVRFSQEIKHSNYLTQFTLDIRLIKGIDNVPADTMSHSINSLSLNLCLEYLQFVEDQLLQHLLQNNPIFFKFLKIHVSNTDSEVIRETSTRRLRLFVPESLQQT